MADGFLNIPSGLGLSPDDKKKLDGIDADVLAQITGFATKAAPTFEGSLQSFVDNRINAIAPVGVYRYICYGLGDCRLISRRIESLTAGTYTIQIEGELDIDVDEFIARVPKNVHLTLDFSRATISSARYSLLSIYFSEGSSMRVTGLNYFCPEDKNDLFAGIISSLDEGYVQSDNNSRPLLQIDNCLLRLSSTAIDALASQESVDMIIKNNRIETYNTGVTPMMIDYAHSVIVTGNFFSHRASSSSALITLPNHYVFSNNIIESAPGMYEVKRKDGATVDLSGNLII